MFRTNLRKYLRMLPNSYELFRINEKSKYTFSLIMLIYERK